MQPIRIRFDLAQSPLLRRAGCLIGDTIKRDIDVVGALCALLLTAPVGMVIALLVAIDGGPIFYRHRRVGRNSRPFGCLKFRTMMMDAEECLPEYLRLHPESMDEWRSEHKLTRDPRVTGIGNLLRRLSLDELPQLWNVLVGEMSLVGPRPVTEGELREKYGSEANLVTSAMPGLTGLWQVSGRNDTDYQRRIAMDVSYVRSRTLFLDLLILLRTPRRVLAGTGAR